MQFKICKKLRVLLTSLSLRPAGYTVVTDQVELSKRVEDIQNFEEVLLMQSWPKSLLTASATRQRSCISYE